MGEQAGFIPVPPPAAIFPFFLTVAGALAFFFFPPPSRTCVQQGFFRGPLACSFNLFLLIYATFFSFLLATLDDSNRSPLFCRITARLSTFFLSEGSMALISTLFPFFRVGGQASF